LSPRIKETLNLSLLALAVVSVVVGLILLIFKISGQQDLLSQMLQSTAEGKISGVAFTAGGPFGMWIIAFLVLRYSIGSAPLGSIKLYLRFPDPQTAPPTHPADLSAAICSYSVFSDGEEITTKRANIQTDQVDQNFYAPYIYVRAPRIDNPEFQVKLEFRGDEWLSDSYSPKKGSVDLQ
jgi:hypothetical protein